MKKPIAFVLLAALLAADAALAHGGKSHRLMGTVKEVRENALTVTTQDGRDQTALLNADTTYEKGGKAAKRADLTPGVRVVVHLDEDDRTAIEVKIAE